MKGIKERREQELTAEAKQEVLNQIEKLSKIIDEKKKKLMERFD